MRTHALLLELARHLGSYMELGAAVASEYRGAWIRRAALVVVAVATGIAGIGALWAAGLVALWDTQWRLAYVTTSGVLLLVASAAALYIAARPPRGSAAGVLKSELRKDMELFQEWKSTLQH